MNVLVTGFERFGKHEVNPSQVIAEELDGVVLPVSYARAAAELPERFAHNLDESDTTDNDAAAGSGAETATRRRRSAGDDGTRDFASEAPTVLAEELREIVGDEALEAAEEQTHHHGGAWTARVDRRTLAREGDEIELAVSTGRLHFFDLETGSGIYGDEARNSSAANRSAVGTVADQK